MREYNADYCSTSTSEFFYCIPTVSATRDCRRRFERRTRKKDNKAEAEKRGADAERDEAEDSLNLFGREKKFTMNSYIVGYGSCCRKKGDTISSHYDNSTKTVEACKRSTSTIRVNNVIAVEFLVKTITLFLLLNLLGYYRTTATMVMPYRTIADDTATNTIAENQDRYLSNSMRAAAAAAGDDDGGRRRKRRCEPITIPLCQRIGYNMTSFPNGYGHERQEEAGLEVHQFYPLVEVNCYKHLKFFLCSMYTPICQDNYELPVMPCREVCLEARKNCAPLMQKYGFRWPATLECDERLPKMSEQESTGKICAAPPDTLDAAIRDDNNNMEVSGANDDDTNSMNTIEYAPSASRDQTSRHRGDNLEKNMPPMLGVNVVGGEASMGAQCECKCVRPFHALVGERRRVSSSNAAQYTVQNVSNCAYSCFSPALHSPEDRAFLNTWISVWSGICLTLSVFTVLTFLTDVSRFPYPERPIFFLSLCQLMVALGFMLRVVYGHERVACDGSLLKISSKLFTMLSFSVDFRVSNRPAYAVDDDVSGGDSDGDPLCLIVFVLVYFFGMCASAWWVILSLSWVLAAVPHWSTEWIAKYSTYFHLFAWLTPAAQTLLVLASNAVDGDPVSGICYVGNTSAFNLRAFVLGPLIVYFFVGVSFLSIGFLNLWGIRANLKKTHPGVDKTSKLTQLMSKIGIFSVLYTVPAIFVILVLVYEQHLRSAWERSQLCPCAQQIENQNGIMLLLALIKLASMLVVGWTSGVWIMSAKTLQSWRRVFGCALACCLSDGRETRRRRRQGYVPAVNRLSGGENGANQLLNVDDITPVHQQFHSSTLPYSVAAEQSLSRQYQQLMYSNNNPNSPFHVYHSAKHLQQQNQPPPLTPQQQKQQQQRVGYASGVADNNNCMSPLTYATNSAGSMRHCGAMPEKV